MGGSWLGGRGYHGKEGELTGRDLDVNPDDIPGLRPDLPGEVPWDQGPRAGGKWWGGPRRGPVLPDVPRVRGGPPGGRGPRIPPLIKLGPNDKIDPTLGRPLNEKGKSPPHRLA